MPKIIESLIYQILWKKYNYNLPNSAFQSPSIDWSVCAKLLEHTIRKQILTHFSKHKICSAWFSLQAFTWKPAYLQITFNGLIQIFESNSQSDTIVLDLIGKAFDVVPHYGIRGTTLLGSKIHKLSERK